MAMVLGTTRYYDDPDRPQAATSDSENAGLKVDKSGKVPIILVRSDPYAPLDMQTPRLTVPCTTDPPAF